MDTTYKIYVRIVNLKLKPIAGALVSEEQNGLRKGRSCTDSTFKRKLIIGERRELNLEARPAFVDLTKAVEKVKRLLF